jgi:phenylpropionate dioxygenase-like ring-hydroxylating dioxygenase large terminal subunit
MAEVPEANGHLDGGREARESTLYERAVLGFRDYWYPVCGSREVTEKPMGLKLLGDPVVLLRRNGVAYALADECAHRGTQLSIGKWEFPGTPTISCRYHGWTYDVRDGKCVAVLCEGPESGVVGKVRVRTYPVQEAKGIVWVWMGKMAPAPLEEDVPKMVLGASIVKFRHGVKYGNWRFHAENVGGGHAVVLHRDTIGSLFSRLGGPSGDPEPVHIEDTDGHYIIQSGRSRVQGQGQRQYQDFPGLGRWPRSRPWRFLGGGGARRLRSIQGVSQPGGASLRLPGITRVLHFPLAGSIYYEWYTPVDADHYIYFQVSTYWPKHLLSHLWFLLRFYASGRPFKFVLFNNQDIRMAGQTTNYWKRRKLSIDYLTPLTKQDRFHFEWRRYVNAWARGEGSEWLKQAPISSGQAEAASTQAQSVVGLPTPAGGSEP